MTRGRVRVVPRQKLPTYHLPPGRVDLAESQKLPTYLPPLALRAAASGRKATYLPFLPYGGELYRSK